MCFFETGNPKGLVGDTGRLRKVLAVIDAAADLAELRTPPNYGLNRLTGDQKISWSMTVTKNWRLAQDGVCRTGVHHREGSRRPLWCFNTAHGIREAQKSPKLAGEPIWPITRVQIWRIVKDVMIEAGIPDAPQRSPKGLRHGYGINAEVKGIPLHMLQKWLGHAQLTTTTIYADSVGKEEQDIASKMWG